MKVKQKFVPKIQKTKEETMTANPMLFGYDFKNVKFIVFARQGYKLSENAKYFIKYFDVITPSELDNGISSTKIRNGILKSDI